MGAKVDRDDLNADVGQELGDDEGEGIWYVAGKLGADDIDRAEDVKYIFDDGPVDDDENDDVGARSCNVDVRDIVWYADGDLDGRLSGDGFNDAVAADGIIEEEMRNKRTEYVTKRDEHATGFIISNQHGDKIHSDAVIGHVNNALSDEKVAGTMKVMAQIYKAKMSKKAIMMRLMLRKLLSSTKMTM